MLFLSLFLAGFALGVFFALRVFSPEKQEDLWDPQLFSQTNSAHRQSLQSDKQKERSRVFGRAGIVSKRQLLPTVNI